MFDGEGLLRAIDSLGRTVAGQRIKLLGAGGAGSAIAFALAGAGAAAVSIHDADALRATKLAQDVSRAHPACLTEAGGAELDGATILINATPVGLAAEDGLPVPLPNLSNETAVVDIVPRQGGTSLLRLAQERGCPHTGGLAMVEGQARAVLEFFRMLQPGAQA
jgi:shikimate dehydrogenase